MRLKSSVDVGVERFESATVQSGDYSHRWWVGRSTRKPRDEADLVAEDMNLGRGRLPVKVLVVDDHEANRRIMHLLLTEAGCRPVLASCGEEAVNVAAQAGVDLIVMDVDVPGIDGGAERSRAIPRGRQVFKGCFGDALDHRSRSLRARPLRRLRAPEADRRVGLSSCWPRPTAAPSDPQAAASAGNLGRAAAAFLKEEAISPVHF